MTTIQPGAGLLSRALNALFLVLRYLLLEAMLFVRRKERPACREKHLLLLAWQFPPIISGGVYRPLELVRQAVEDGWRVTVACADSKHASAVADYLLARVPPSTRVLRFKMPPLLPLCGMHEGLRLFEKGEQLFSFLKRTLGDDCPSLVVATGPPFFTFISASFFSRYYAIPLALDYRDEWSECPFPFVEILPSNRGWEAACAARAQRIIFTTESQRDHQLEVFPEMNPDLCDVVPNGWVPEDFGAEDLDGILSVSRKCNANPKCRISILFAGFLSQHSDPRGFLDNLAEVLKGNSDLRARIGIYFIGIQEQSTARAIMAWKYADCIQMFGQVPKDKAVELMALSSILLLPNGKDMNRYIPGKLYDYVASRRPILVYGLGGEIGNLVESLGVGTCVAPGDPEALKRSIEALLEWDNSGDRINKWLLEHTRTRGAEKMLDIFNELIGKGT